MNLKLVGLLIVGGFLGSITRFSFGEWLLNEVGFPAGTLFVNIVGCFFLGWFLPFANEKIKNKSFWIPLIGTGFIGSFTTFSTFSVETLFLINEELYLIAFSNIVLSIGFGILAAFIGYSFAFKKISEKGEEL